VKKRADYLICYDIADPKRLRRIARELQKVAIRIQYSIFFAPEISQKELFDIIDIIDENIEPQEDDVRIYTVVDYGVSLGKAKDLSKVTIVS